ncbi:MAG: aspartate carbamoyltransferase, partial [Methanobacterium paludis]|nr:aspartate carbamoyltransferase [Methanobacterium paludis]
MDFNQKDIISIRDFSKEDIEYILDVAEKMEPVARSKKRSNVLSGNILGMLFYEPSTRTRLSFETAMKRLGGSTIGFAEANVSSATKGENLADTAKIV